jgi:hypothetical protein
LISTILVPFGKIILCIYEIIGKESYANFLVPLFVPLPAELMNTYTLNDLQKPVRKLRPVRLDNSAEEGKFEFAKCASSPGYAPVSRTVMITIQRQLRRGLY